MRITKEIFREYDIRGLIKKQLTEKEVKTISQAYAYYLKKTNKKIKKIVLCRDNRKSSEQFYLTAKNALLESGFNVLGLGLNHVGVFYFALHKFNPVGGIMVTASHLPPKYNGLKLGAGKGILTLGGRQIQEIRKIIEKGKPKTKTKKGKYREKKLQKEYIEYIKKNVKITRKPKILIDCGNGTTSVTAKKLFQEIGCKVNCLYCTSNPDFPNHLPDPNKKENMQKLITHTKKQKYLCGIAFDGDGDRIGAVTEKGEIIEADKLLALFAEDILQKQKNKAVVFEVKCSNTVRDVITKNKGKPVEWKAGHSLIKQKMKKTSAVLGGEMSGHLFFSDKWPGFDDGLYAGARLIELLSNKKQKLSTLIKKLPKYHSTPEIRIEVGEKNKWKIVTGIKNYFKKRNPLTIDGVKVYFNKNWLLVRASNTSPKISIRIEAKTKKQLEELKKRLSTAFKKVFPKIKVNL